MKTRDTPDEETSDWRAVCGRTARTVRRAGGEGLPTPIWPGLVAIGKVRRIREEADKTTQETAYYLLSKALTGERFLEVVRSHWGVENRLHWRLDVVMNEDQQRNRLDNGPNNLTVLRHMALNVMQKDPTKRSLHGKRKRASWDENYLKTLLALF